ncbi:MAG: hypothetical protein F4Y70_05755, partial [Chloroflexi bacterium]|nr:hypothetical protein [Chloroflexota bacterium]
MTQTRNPLARAGIYAVLVLFTIYNVLPFCWTILNSLKLPKDANSRTPRFIFQPTGEHYADLWLNMRPEDFAPYGLALLWGVFALVVIVVYATR